ncbi:ABC transporter permease [Terrirubrum flagellatum]|uniref:ABC transporter permease n=1 Tax=Terrirubrum flagellatum TaxID=2895980 RepID=UPI003CC81309
MTAGVAPSLSPVRVIAPPSLLRRIGRQPGAAIGAVVLLLFVVAAIFAPLITGHDPTLLDPLARMKPPTGDHLFGTDRLGRDIFSRTIYSARISLSVASATTVLALLAGAALGMIAGYVRAFDALIMRIMDGVNAIPAVLLGIALMVLSGGAWITLVIAIALPKTPAVVRLIRSVVLTVREEPYIEAAIALGTSTPRILARHVLRNVIAPMIVIGSYVAASAIMAEAMLSFLGAGTPPEIPSWGNMITENRAVFQIAPWGVFFPSIFLGVAVWSVNLVGDGLRDMLDPRLAKGL